MRYLKNPVRLWLPHPLGALAPMLEIRSAARDRTRSYGARSACEYEVSAHDRNQRHSRWTGEARHA
jgi:hypothetical protein